MERLGIIVTRPESYLARTLYSLKPAIVSVYLWRTDCYLWQEQCVVQSIIVIKDKTMASQFSYQLSLALWPGCLQTVQLGVLLPFSPRDLSFNVQFSTNTAQWAPARPLCPQVPQNKYFPPTNRSQKIFLLILLKDFHSRVLNQPGCWANNGQEI